MKKNFLLSSLMMVVLCIALISGATFALFTSESKTNITIQSGKVSVLSEVTELKTFSMEEEQQPGYFANGGTAVLNEGNLTLEKVTPGDKVTFKLNVKNESNVSVQYRVVVTSSGELAGALVLKENGETIKAPVWHKLAADKAGVVETKDMSIELPVSAGNEYQEKSATIVISVIAVQGNAPIEEEAGLYVVNGLTYVALEDAIAAASASDSTVYVLGDVDVAGAAGTSQTKDFAGVLIEGLENPTLTFTNVEGSNSTGTCTLANLNLKNITVVDETYCTGENGENAWEFTYLEFAGQNKFENVVFTDGIFVEDGHSEFVKCSFSGHNNDSSEYGNVTMYAAWVYSGSANFTECSFEGTRGLKVADQYSGSDVTKVVVDNCVFGPLSEKPGLAVDNRKGALELVIKNSTFKETQPGDGALNAENGVPYIYENDNRTHADTTIILENNKVLGPRQQVAEGVAYDEVSKTYFVSSKAGMYWFADQVNAQGKSFEGQTVALDADIDLNNEAWTPVGQTGATEFKGVFDGQNHTIYNLNVDSSAQTGKHYSSGLFGWIEDHGQAIKIMNVTVDGATVKGHHNVAVIVGYLEGASVVSNCHVLNATLENTHANDDACGDKTGLIAGYAGASARVIDCSGADSTIVSGRDAGQLVGAAKTVVVVNGTATNVTVSANGSCPEQKNINNDLIGRVL